MTANNGRGLLFRRVLVPCLLAAALAQPGRADVNWAGPYIGVNGGYGWGKASTSFPSDGDSVGTFGSGDGTPGEPPDGDFDQQLHGAVYGLQAGFNAHVWKNLYGGFEAAYEQGDIVGASQNNLPNVYFPDATVDYKIRVDALFTLAPQVGIAWDRVLFRAKGGLAVGRVASMMSNLGSANNNGETTAFGQDQTHVGWTYGLGADYALTDHWLVGLAYDYYDLGTIQFGGQTAPDTNWPLSYEIHPILRTVSARVSYKFGGEDPSSPSWNNESEAATMDWAGPYIGVNGGYGWGKASTSFPGDADADGTFGSGDGGVGEPSDGDFDHALHGGIYGLHAGFNTRVWKNLYGGFEAAYEQGDVVGASQDNLANVDFPGMTVDYETRVNALFAFAPQVGIAWNRMLFHAKGGFAAGRVASMMSNLSSTNNNGGPTTFGQDQTHIGWTCGLGVDYALTDHWLVGLAYDYYDLGTIQFGGLSSPDSNYVLSYEVHPILRAATFRLSYKFGGERSEDESGNREPEPEPARTPAPSAPVVEVPETADPADALIQSLKTGDGKARAEAAIQLGNLRRTAAVEPLIAALSDESLAVRGTAANALGKIGDHRAVVPLMTLLQDPQPKVRALAARALGALGDTQAVPLLKKTAANDADPLVRKMAGAALKQMPETGPTIDESFTWSDLRPAGTHWEKIPETYPQKSTRVDSKTVSPRSETAGDSPTMDVREKWTLPG